LHALECHFVLEYTVVLLPTLKIDQFYFKSFYALIQDGKQLNVFFDTGPDRIKKSCTKVVHDLMNMITLKAINNKLLPMKTRLVKTSFKIAVRTGFLADLVKHCK
jgi:hypothetical protein